MSLSPNREKALGIAVECLKGIFAVGVTLFGAYVGIFLKGVGTKYWLVLDWGLVICLPLAIVLSIIALYLFVSPLIDNDDPFDQKHLEVIFGFALLFFLAGLLSGCAAIIERAFLFN